MTSGGASVLAAAKSMQMLDEPVLVVIDEKDGKRVAVGIVTEREIARNVVARGADPSQLALRDVMRQNLCFVNEADDVFETACWMHRNHLREAVVHDETGGLVGLVTIEQLIDNLAGDLIDFTEPAGAEASPAGHIPLH